MTEHAQMGLFDPVEGRRRKEEGMSRASAKHGELLRMTRAVAVQIARGRLDSCCWADLVQQEMLRRYEWYAPDMLGNAAGSIFRGTEWTFTGRRVQSARIANHSRELKVWHLLG